MAFTVDWVNKIVDSSTSIADIVAARGELRALESSLAGMLRPAILTYKEIDLGGSARFSAVDFVNGYRLRFPAAGNYIITGNLNATILPVAGVYVERRTSAAFATTSGGAAAAGGLTVEQHDMLAAIAKIHGLVAGTPLVVTATSRTAGDVAQTIAESGETVTIART